MKVFVLNMHGKPLMPTTARKARLLLRDGKATIAGRKPFTLQLNYPTPDKVQDITLGVDAGYQTIGFSAVTDKEELIGGEVEMLKGQNDRNEERAMYRRNRRGRKRYRRPAWRRSRKHRQFKKPDRVPDGWLAPSIKHKLDTHIRLIESLCAVMPVTYIIIETANFDIQGIKNPDLEGIGYQTGGQAGFWNLREYILHRDHHQCQNPDCKGRSEILQVHHIGYWQDDHSDRPGNLITLCIKCHTTKNHQKGKLLFGWKPKVKSFRPETFMSTVRWRLLNHFDAINAYGYQTKSVRIDLGIEKSHHNDALVIACGANQRRAKTTYIKQRRRNNRSLEKFYDAKYIDLRTGEKASGQELSSGRRTRNRNLNSENLRQYRADKLKPGRRSIRRQRYALQPGDIVLHEDVKHTVKGVHSYGKYVKLENGTGKPINTSVGRVRSLRQVNGLCWW